MNAKRHNRFGYTLTELLIVLAILAMLSGLAIPAVVKIGGFLSKKSDAAARDLYGVLRAARISAISYRKDTAVVYVVHWRPDNYSNGQSYIIDGYSMATRATKEQVAFILNPPTVVVDNAAYQDLENSLAAFAARLNDQSIQEDDVFILPQETQARFRAMPNNTAVIGHLTAQEEQTLAATGFVDVPPQSLAEFVDGTNDPEGRYRGLHSRGMRTIYMFRERDADGFLEPIAAEITIDPAAAPLSNAFPAHVFLPTGELSVPGDSLEPWKERITIAVGASPDAPLEDRFTVAPNEGPQPVMAAPARIEVYRSTGRIQIGS
ncbi:MAG: prepilin-type N-terminal cleavage/methylation domain-containing protein [Candidatus Hydrogenedentes bacterium]|nr:prepilin-type N-terminal cleavage/methylation domain-containing protein [Candidatus Hydrogenedentota bacterium]